MLQLDVPEIQFAIQAVRQASLLVSQIQKELVLAEGGASLTKDDLSPVTVADFASQAIVAGLLAQAFPGEPLVAEEDSAALKANPQALDLVTGFVQRCHAQADEEAVCRWIDHQRADTAQRFWTLDPIDGTKGFLRGDQYAIALALVVDGKVQLGVLGCPNLTEACRVEMGGPGSLVAAFRGQGTWTTNLQKPGAYKRLQVSVQDIPSQARILRSFESGHTNVSQIDLFAQALGVQAEPVRMDSQAKYAMLAAGGGEIILRLLSPARPDYKEKIWDQAAGSIILEEAGGQISDLHGKSLDFTSGRSLTHNRGILASNGSLHQEALRALEAVAA